MTTPPLSRKFKEEKWFASVFWHKPCSFQYTNWSLLNGQELWEWKLRSESLKLICLYFTAFSLSFSPVLNNLNGLVNSGTQYSIPALMHILNGQSYLQLQRENTADNKILLIYIILDSLFISTENGVKVAGKTWQKITNIIMEI